MLTPKTVIIFLVIFLVFAFAMSYAKKLDAESFINQTTYEGNTTPGVFTRH